MFSLAGGTGSVTPRTPSLKYKNVSPRSPGKFAMLSPKLAPLAEIANKAEESAAAAIAAELVADLVPAVVVTPAVVSSLKKVDTTGAEMRAFATHINNCLSGDASLSRHLPLNCSDDANMSDLFAKCQDGVLLCKLVNLAVPDAIDERAVHVEEAPNLYQQTANQHLALNAARAIGCQLVNIKAKDLRPAVILELLWQVIKIQLLAVVSPVTCRELLVLLADCETVADFMKLHSDVLLLRWLNYHLHKAGSRRDATNFGADLAVRKCYFSYYFTG